MSKNSKPSEQFVVLYSDGDFGCISSLEEATSEAIEAAESAIMEGPYTVYKLIPVRLVKETEIVVEDL